MDTIRSGFTKLYVWSAHERWTYIVAMGSLFLSLASRSAVRWNESDQVLVQMIVKWLAVMQFQFDLGRFSFTGVNTQRKTSGFSWM